MYKEDSKGIEVRDINTIILGNINTALAHSSLRQKMSTATVDLNHITDLVDLSDIHRTFHPARSNHCLLKFTRPTGIRTGAHKDKS